MVTGSCNAQAHTDINEAFGIEPCKHTQRDGVRALGQFFSRLVETN